MPEGITIKREHPDQDEIRVLWQARENEISALYAGMAYGEGYRLGVEALAAPDVVFLVGRGEGRAIAMGALVLKNADLAEMKSVYVVPDRRKHGIAKTLVEALEREALAAGRKVIRLETGNLQPGAIRLYENAGYRRIPPFGTYSDHALSVFMEKHL